MTDFILLWIMLIAMGIIGYKVGYVRGRTQTMIRVKKLIQNELSKRDE